MKKAVCNACNKRVTKVWNGKYKSARTKEKVYVDSKGKPWNGKKCNSCKVTYYREYYRDIRKTNEKPPKIKEEVLLGPGEVKDSLTHRKCIECNKRLPKSRYFRHKECEAVIHSSEGQGFYTAEDWGYGNYSSASEPLNFKISEMNLLGAT